jgi:hypothetical protein
MHNSYIMRNTSTCLVYKFQNLDDTSTCLICLKSNTSPTLVQTFFWGKEWGQVVTLWGKTNLRATHLDVEVMKVTRIMWDSQKKLLPYQTSQIWLIPLWMAWVNRLITDHLLVTEHFVKTFLAKFFFILIYLKCYKSAFSSSTNHLWNEKPKDQPKKRRAVKKICFFELQSAFYFNFFHFDPSYFQTSQLSYFLFILNDLKC